MKGLHGIEPVREGEQTGLQPASSGDIVADNSSADTKVVDWAIMQIKIVNGT